MAENPDQADRRVTEATEQAEAEAERLEKHKDEVSERIDEVREDWERKQADSSVPGAEPGSTS